VHSAEDDRLGIRTALRGLRQLEGVAHEVRVRQHLLALVKVPEDHDPVAERGLGGTDAVAEFLRRRATVDLGQLTLPR